MEKQIFFKGIIEYLYLFVGINKHISLDIASQLDLENPSNLYVVDLPSYLSAEQINDLKIKLITHPITPTAFLLGIGFPPNLTEIILKFYNKSESLVKTIQDRAQQQTQSQRRSAIFPQSRQEDGQNAKVLQ